MTYVRETCGCCGESWLPHGSGAWLPQGQDTVSLGAVIQGSGSSSLLQSQFSAMHLAVCP